MEQIKFSELSKDTVLLEQTDYGILFDNEISNCPEGYKGVLEMLSPNTGRLNFGNCIGDFDFFGTTIRVESKKISNNQYEEMLMYVAGKMAELPFCFNSPTFESIDIDDLSRDKILYHTFIILRYIVLNAEVNLEGSFEYIFRNPSRRMERESFECNSWEASNIDMDTFYSVVSVPDRLNILNESSDLNKTGISKSLSRGRTFSYFPEKVTSFRFVNTLDTPENRFVKHFLQVCMEILYAFQLKLSSYRLLSQSTIYIEIKSMTEIIEMLLNHSFFERIGDMRSLPSNSTIMQMRNGYKEILQFYNLIQSSIKIPMFEGKAKLIIENKDVAELYEIWTYFKTVELVEKVTGVPAEVAYLYCDNDFTITLKHSACVEFICRDQKIKVWYNKSFGRNKGSYSLTLRPDIIIETPKGLYIFDAKFKLECINWDSDDEEKNFTFKNGDIYKMHTYKDAIENVKMACILYPNKDTSKDKMFWEDDDKTNGVGAFSLLPDTEPFGLKNLLKDVILEV